jgi:hypothetical protein
MIALSLGLGAFVIVDHTTLACSGGAPLKDT